MGIRDDYAGVIDVLPEVIVATNISGTLHRPEGDGEAWCGTFDAGEYFETEIAISYGGELCRSCFRSAMEHLARMPSSPVRRLEGQHVAPSTEIGTQTRPPERKLSALTAEVVVASGSGSNTFHAPDEDDNPVCTVAMQNPQRRRVDHTPPTARPCRRCFTGDVVEKYAGRDADLTEINQRV